MNINIYEYYKIKVTGDYTHLSEENKTIYDNINEEVILTGSELLDMIGARLLDNSISEFVIVGNEIHFETFNQNNGENSSICYEIKEYFDTYFGNMNYDIYLGEYENKEVCAIEIKLLNRTCKEVNEDYRHFK